MDWFVQLFLGNSPAQCVVVIAMTIVIGLAFGLIQIRGIRLGVGGVLFSGLAIGHFGFTVNPDILSFIREFGLILFVFSIGIQVGPGFIDSLRRRGVKQNLLAAFIVLLGIVTTIIVFYVFGIPLPVAVGLFSGGVTNTPALAAASQVFHEMLPPDLSAQAISDAGLGYALAYPFGIVGVIMVMLLVRFIFRINPANELKQLDEQIKAQNPGLNCMTLRVVNQALFNKKLSELPRTGEHPPVISWLREPGKNGRTIQASADAVLLPDMLVHAVGDEKGLKDLQILIGPAAPEEHTGTSGDLEIRSFLVTRMEAIEKPLKALNLRSRFGVSVTRIVRAGVEFSPRPDLYLHFGDKIAVIGPKQGLDETGLLLGNSSRALNQPHILPIFIGILIGTIMGSLPIAIPGLPSGVKLGLAGGPLLVAIFLSRMHRIGGMIWYMPTSANLILREIGIALFLACVGLHAGKGFVAVLIDGSGFTWMGIAALITFIPLMAAAVIGRLVLKFNYTSICGLLAGSMTSPAALAFTTQMLGSDTPASVYASVYPFTMILRVLAGQILVILLYALG
ncbi:MAG: putative transporter [Desulfovibrionaceae bacterium]|nr:putative transporter [Desulfovibrionaceae bacterium]